MTNYRNDNPPSVPADVKARKFVFAGNRQFVLEEMMARGIEPEIFVVRDSHLERHLRAKGHSFTVIRSKEHLISRLDSTDYDLFLANGCPYILPVSGLRKGGRTFVNVHPGPLPDLRGIDPVPGALLLGRDSGAACHIMDDGIDTGPVISRIVVPNTADLDAGLLYQISFQAEKEAFAVALERGFLPMDDREAVSSGVYYSKKFRDLIIDFREPAEAIIRRIKAFSNRSQGARFSFNGTQFRVFDAEPVFNPYLTARRDSYTEGEVVFRYENCLLLRKGGAFLKLKAIEGDLSVIQAGDVLGGAEPEVRPAAEKVSAS